MSLTVHYRSGCTIISPCSAAVHGRSLAKVGVCCRNLIASVIAPKRELFIRFGRFAGALWGKWRIVSIVPWLPSKLNNLHDDGSRKAVRKGLVGLLDGNVAITDAAVRQISSL